jgi:hypothetical protein
MSKAAKQSPRALAIEKALHLILLSCDANNPDPEERTTPQQCFIDQAKAALSMPIVIK